MKLGKGVEVRLQLDLSGLKGIEQWAFAEFAVEVFWTLSAYAGGVDGKTTFVGDANHHSTEVKNNQIGSLAHVDIMG